MAVPSSGRSSGDNRDPPEGALFRLYTRSPGALVPEPSRIGSLVFLFVWRCEGLQVRSVPTGTVLVALGVGQWLSHAIILGKSARTAREPLFPRASVSLLGKVKKEALRCH